MRICFDKINFVENNPHLIKLSSIWNLELSYLFQSGV